MCRGLAVRGALSAALLAARTLHAESGAPILLSYDAPAECPDVAEFERQVGQRSSQIRFVSEGPHARELTVQLRRVRDQLNGELDLIESGGPARRRTMRFRSCVEAVEGLALIAVMSLEPGAGGPQQPPEPAERSAPSESEPAASEPSAPPRAAPARATPATRSTLVTSPKPPTSSSLQLALGAGAEAATEFSFPALGGTLFLDVQSGSRTWLAPLVRLAVSHWERRAVTAPDSTLEAHFAFTLATLSACPVQWDARALVLRPCLNLELGAVHSWASRASDVRGASNPFISWGGSLLLLVPLGQLFELYADAGLNANLIRYHFEFQNQPFLSTPELYVSTGVGFRLHLR